MNEIEWLESANAGRLLNLLFVTPGIIYKGVVQQHPRGRRRLRLFGVAVARRILHLISSPVLLKLHEAAESYADGKVSFQDVEALLVECGIHCDLADPPGVIGGGSNYTIEWFRWLLTRTTQQKYADLAVATLATREAFGAASFHEYAAIALEGENALTEIARQAEIVREIFGNPFRSIIFDPAWRTTTAIQLAQQMYDAHDYSTMPILADALQDAGCENDEILNHCRSSTASHVRGCWVADLVLGKA
jgi:hypothetical protein